MTKSDEAYWKRYFPERATLWIWSPFHLVYDLKMVMNSVFYTAKEKLELMRWAMDAYNDALNGTIANTTGSGQHRTSCPEHTED